MTGRPRQPLLDRLVDRIVITGDCWLWEGTCNEQGYGMISSGGTGGRLLRVHRVVYEWLVGPIPEGFQLDHTCHNGTGCPGGSECPHRRCVNPAHLEPVTSGDNTRRGEGPSAQAARRERCPQGHPYDAENTWVSGKGKRQCRTCNRERQRDRRAKVEV